MAIINHNGKEYEYDPRAVRFASSCEITWFSPIIERKVIATDVVGSPFVYKGLVEYDPNPDDDDAIGCAIHFWSLPENTGPSDSWGAGFESFNDEREWIDPSVLDEGWCPDTDGGFHLFLDFWIKTHTHWTLDHVEIIDAAVCDAIDFYPGGSEFDYPIKEEWSCNVFNEVPAGWTPVDWMPSFVNRYTVISDKDGNVDYIPSLLPIFDTYFYDYKFTCESAANAWSEDDTLIAISWLVVPLLPHYFGYDPSLRPPYTDLWVEAPTSLTATQRELSLRKVKEIFDTHDIHTDLVAGWMDLLEAMPRVCVQILNWFIEYHQFTDDDDEVVCIGDENEALNEIFSYTAYFLSELYPELHAQYLGGERDPIEVRKGVLNCLEAVVEQNEE